MEEAEERCCPRTSGMEQGMAVLEDRHQGSTGAWHRTGQRLPLITGNVVLVLEGVPAFDLLVLVLQTFIPVFQALSLSRNAKLAAPWKRGRRDIIFRDDADVPENHFYRDRSHIWAIPLHLLDLKCGGNNWSCTEDTMRCGRGAVRWVFDGLIQAPNQPVWSHLRFPTGWGTHMSLPSRQQNIGHQNQSTKTCSSPM